MPGDTAPALGPVVEWNLAPGLLLALSVYLGLYSWRWRDARREGDSRGAPVWRLILFAGGIAMLFAALASPIDRLGEQLFVMHAVQHVLLLDFAPILIVLGMTKSILRPLTARVARLERRAGPFAHPVFAVVFLAGTLWMWHVPALYDLSLERSGVHVVQHVQFASAGLLFWWHLLSPIRSRRRLEGMKVTYYVAGAKLFTGAVAAILTFSPRVLYQAFADQPRYWGLSTLKDQNLGGGVMMLEESAVLTIAMAFLFVRMLSESEQEEQRRERLELG